MLTQMQICVAIWRQSGRNQLRYTRWFKNKLIDFVSATPWSYSEIDRMAAKQRWRNSVNLFLHESLEIYDITTINRITIKPWNINTVLYICIYIYIYIYTVSYEISTRFCCDSIYCGYISQIFLVYIYIYIYMCNWLRIFKCSLYYNDARMGARASQITSLTIVYSTVYAGRSKKTSKLRITGLCVGNSPVTGEFPTQMSSNAENVSIWWRHHYLQLRWPSGGRRRRPERCTIHDPSIRILSRTRSHMEPMPQHTQLMVHPVVIHMVLCHHQPTNRRLTHHPNNQVSIK